MHNASFRRKTLLFLVVSILATPWAAAAGPRTHSAGIGQAGELFRFDFLGSLCSLLQSAWSKEGCGIDPNGGCLPSATQPPVPPIHPKSGCRIDPSGQCLPAVAQPPSPVNPKDSGCRIDPDGLCRS